MALMHALLRGTSLGTIECSLETQALMSPIESMGLFFEVPWG